MTYTKTVWVDEALDGVERFEVLDNVGAAVDNVTDLAQCQIKLKTAVVTPGTSVDAANLNNIENGIAALAAGAALSVKGVAGAAAGDVADIAAATDGHVLRRSGTGIGFGTVVAAGLATDAVETAKIKDLNVTAGKLAAGAVTPAKTSFLTDSGIYSGRIAADGSALKLPSGWSSSRTSIGTYQVTHNLGTTNYTIVAMGDFSFAVHQSLGINTVNIRVLRETNGVLAFVDAIAHFILIKD